MELRNVALAPFLARCPGVLTLGVRPCIEDYSVEERELLRSADRVLFPTPRFAPIFHAVGIPCFPSYYSYRYQRSRFLQKTLLEVLAVPRPKSRVYFGSRQKRGILKEFSPPFLLMGVPMNSPDAYVIGSPKDLDEVSDRYNPVLVRRLIEWQKQVRLVFTHYECIAAQLMTDCSRGGPGWSPVSLEDEGLEELISKTRRILSMVQIDDIMVHWGLDEESWKLIEMSRPPVVIQTFSGYINRHEIVCGFVRDGVLDSPCGLSPLRDGEPLGTDSSDPGFRMPGWTESKTRSLRDPTSGLHRQHLRTCKSLGPESSQRKV